MTYFYSHERMEHCITNAKFVKVYDRDNPPTSVVYNAAITFAMDMNSRDMRALLDSLSAPDRPIIVQGHHHVEIADG